MEKFPYAKSHVVVSGIDQCVLWQGEDLVERVHDQSMKG